MLILFDSLLSEMGNIYGATSTVNEVGSTSQISISEELGPQTRILLQNLIVHYRVHRRLPLGCILSLINPVHFSYPVSLTSILILSSHLHPGLPSGLVPRFQTKILYALPIPMRVTCSAQPNKL